MKKFDFGQTITVIANIGVIAGIVFLAIELRQNNEFMGAQQRFNRLTLATTSATLMAENPELAEVLAKAETDPEALSRTETIQLLGFGDRILVNMQWTFNELPRSSLPVGLWRRIVREPWWQIAWAERRDEYDSDFVEYLELNFLH